MTTSYDAGCQVPCINLSYLLRGPRSSCQKTSSHCHVGLGGLSCCPYLSVVTMVVLLGSPAACTAAVFTPRHAWMPQNAPGSEGFIRVHYRQI